MVSRNWFVVALLVFTASAVIADDTPPVVTPNVSGTLGDNGWYVSDVALSWTIVDEESAIVSTTGCEASVVTQDDTGRTFTCSATSEGGTTIVSQTIARDATSPVISYSNNQGTYQVGDQINIFCNAFDATSGIASSTCTDFTAAALGLIGVNTLSASAVDNAGNTSTASATFEVVVTHAGVATLVERYVTKESVARSLVRKLLAAGEAEASGNLAAEQRNIDAFIHTLDRHIGKHISPGDADTLLELVAML